MRKKDFKTTNQKFTVESGAGEEGTKQLSYKYRKDTPKQSINGKTETNMKRQEFIPKSIIDEDVPAFMGALAQAAKDGKKEFEFGGKTFKVKLKKDVADKITKNMDESEDFDGLLSDLVEASAADYAKLSDSDLIDLFAIFKNVGRDAAKPVILAIKREMKKRSMKEDVELQEATLPFKELEKAWIRAKDNDKKKEKLIKRHNLKPLISNVRPGAIKLGPLNNLKMKTGNHTMAGLDADGELIFVTNNPLKIRYPSSGNIKDRPRGQEMKESVSLETLRLRKVIQLSVNESDEKIIDSFIAESDVDISWAPSKIFKTFSQYLKEGAYPLYHRSFTDAAQAAIDLALRKGFEVDEDDWFDQVTTGPKKPSKGKTNRYIIKVTKNGKETRKRLAFQVYGMDSGKYELNAYVESTQIKESEMAGWVAIYNGKKVEIKKSEANDLYGAKMKAAKMLKVPKSKMGLLAIKPAYVESTQIQEGDSSVIDQIKTIVSDKQAAKIGGKMIDMQTASVISQIYDKVSGVTKKRMENDKIENLVKIAQRVMAKESTDLEEIVGTVALGTVVAVGTLAAMFGVVKGAKYMANKLGDAAQSYVDKKDLAAVQAKRSKYQDKIDSITAKFDGDTKLQSMYKSLPEFSRSNTKAAVTKNADRTKKMGQIAKYIKSKLDAEELKAFTDISKSLRSKNEEYGEVEEAIVYRDIRHAIELLKTTPGATKFRDSLMKKDQDAKISSSDLKRAKEIFANMSTTDSANVEKKRKDRYFPRFGVKALEESSDKELDIKSLKDLIKNPSPKMIKQYGGKDKYIKMLKSKLAKLESIEENIGVEDGRRVIVKALTKPAALRLQKKLRNKFNSYDFNIDKSGLSIIVPNEKHIIRFINKQPEVDTIGESVDLEEAIKWWTVTITKKAGKLFKGQTVDVKASNSAQAIKKGLKQMKADPMTVPSGSVDAVLGESKAIDFEKTNVLTYDEYDEVRNFRNFNKKDWKRNVIQRKYIRKKKV